MIKTVIFDIGRVLIGFEWKDYDCSAIRRWKPG